MKCEALLGTAVPSLNMASASTVALAERVYDFTLSHPSAVGMSSIRLQANVLLLSPVSS